MLVASRYHRVFPLLLLDHPGSHHLYYWMCWDSGGTIGLSSRWQDLGSRGGVSAVISCRLRYSTLNIKYSKTNNRLCSRWLSLLSLLLLDRAAPTGSISHGPSRNEQTRKQVSTETREERLPPINSRRSIEYLLYSNKGKGQ